MPDPAIMRDNERVRMISRVTSQLGSVLFAAAVVKVYGAGRFTVEAATWLLVVSALMLTAWKVLILLESES